MIQSLNEIREWIKRKLGSPPFCLEINESQLDDAIEEAILWYNGKKGLKKFALLLIDPAVQEYDVPDDCIEVIDVFFFHKRYLLKDDFGFLWGIPFFGSWSPVALFQGRIATFHYSTFVQWLQYLEMGKRVLSFEKDWEFRKSDRKLILYGLGFSEGGYIAYEYLARIDENNLATMDPLDYKLIRDYALACAKEVLGRVRSKWRDIPVVGGSTSLDGETLLSEAKEEKEKLEEKIMEYGYPTGIITG
jgi:hypothetical protein